jgi:endonuclease G
MASAALEALEQGDVPSPAELAALELVVRLMRPAPLSQQGALAPLTDEAAAAFADWPTFQAAAKPYLYSIGRIDRISLNGDADVTIGTGFVVSYEQDLLVTNRHVLDDLSRGTRALQKGQAAVRFKREFMSAPDEKPVPILGVVAVSPSLDIALLKLEKTPPADGRQPLSFSPEPASREAPVVAVGYPCYDERNPVFIGPIFGENFGVKRAAPGLVTGLGPEGLYHDCSTLGGNSGSPLLSMKSAEVVGLHHEGRFMYRNEAISAALVQDFVAPHLG